MTFKDVFGRLDAIDREAVSLLEAAGFHPDEGPGETVRPLRDPAEDIFLREFTENLLESLELLHSELACPRITEIISRGTPSLYIPVARVRLNKSKLWDLFRNLNLNKIQTFC